jgi:hypothetical protein
MSHDLRRGSRKFGIADTPVTASDYYLSTFPSLVLDYNIPITTLGGSSQINLVKDTAYKTHLDLGGATSTSTPAGTSSLEEIGGVTYANFSSTQFLTSSLNFTMSMPFTIFTVAKETYIGTNYHFLYDGVQSSGPRCTVYAASSGVNQIFMGINSMEQGFSYDWIGNTNKWRLFETHWNLTSTSSLWINNVLIGSPRFSGSGAFGGVTFGCRADGAPSSFGWHGGIARMAFFNSEITGSDLINIRTYLRNMYNLSFPVS